MIFNEITPNEIQSAKNKAFIDGINIPNDDFQLKIYLTYKKLLTYFLSKELNLKKYDEEILKSKLNFLPVSNINTDLYQFTSSDFLKYFYLRNNLYLERLNNHEMQFLIELTNKTNFEYNQNCNEFIKSTFKKVISEDISSNSLNKTMSFFGPNSQQFLLESDAIVIGFRYDAYNKKNMTDDEWLSFHNMQEKFIYNYLDNVRTNLENKFDIPVRLIKYSEFSIGNNQN